MRNAPALAQALAHALAFGLILFCPVAPAGLFDDPSNLKVLPEDISPEQLRDTMKGFALGTGLRCNNCHVGEGNDLSSYDFPADDEDSKKTARIMMRMMNDINQRLADELGGEQAALVGVQCVTCHRGQPKPRMLEQVLAESFAENGLEDTIARYRQLREKYYGSHTFDFSDMVLVNVASRLATEGHQPAAIDMLDLNLEFNPRSLMSLVTQGQLLAASGDRDGARAKLEMAQSLDPDNPWIRQQLKSLD